MPDNERRYGTIVTDIGTILIRQAITEGKKINLTTLCVGDGGGAYYQPTPDMKELRHKCWSGPINKVAVNRESKNMIDIVAKIPADVGGWTIREMSVDDEEGNMIAICNTPDTEKVLISSGAAGEIEMTMQMQISNTGVITFIVDPNIIGATKQDIEDHDKSPTAHEEQFRQKADLTDFNAHVSDQSIHVTEAQTENNNLAITGLIAHKEDRIVHITADERAAWNEASATAKKAAADAADAVQRITTLEGRVSHVEDGLFSNITGNPFLVSFDSLSGVKLVKGIWNKEQQRIEC